MVKLGSISKSPIKVLVIEPHADDALLGAYSFIQKYPEFEFSVLTCCSHDDLPGRSSDSLTEYLPQIKSVSHLQFSELNYLWDSKGYNYRDIFRLSREYNSYEWTLNKAQCRGTYLSDVTELAYKLMEVQSKYQFVLIPFGLMHPFHLLVAEACRASIPPGKSICYFEMSHYNKPTIYKKVVPDGLSKYYSRGYNYKSPVKYEYSIDTKFNIFKSLYPTEMKLMEGDKLGHLQGEAFLLSTKFRKLIKEGVITS